MVIIQCKPEGLKDELGASTRLFEQCPAAYTAHEAPLSTYYKSGIECDCKIWKQYAFWRQEENKLLQGTHIFFQPARSGWQNDANMRLLANATRSLKELQRMSVSTGPELGQLLYQLQEGNPKTSSESQLQAQEDILYALYTYHIITYSHNNNAPRWHSAHNVEERADDNWTHPKAAQTAPAGEQRSPSPPQKRFPERNSGRSWKWMQCSAGCFKHHFL